MQSQFRSLRSLSLCALVLAVAIPAAAQNVPKVEVSGGYSLLKFSDETFPGGWYADVAGNINRVFAIVGQGTGNYKTIDASGVSVDTKLHGFMGGVRVIGPNRNLAPFAQALFGGVRTSGSSDLSGVLPFSVSAGETDAAMQLGGGVNIMSARNVGLRVGVDYVRIFATDAGTNALRFTTGIVIPFGK